MAKRKAQKRKGATSTARKRKAPAARASAKRPSPRNPRQARPRVVKKRPRTMPSSARKAIAKQRPSGHRQAGRPQGVQHHQKARSFRKATRLDRARRILEESVPDAPVFAGHEPPRIGGPHRPRGVGRAPSGAPRACRPTSRPATWTSTSRTRTSPATKRPAATIHPRPGHRRRHRQGAWRGVPGQRGTEGRRQSRQSATATLGAGSGFVGGLQRDGSRGRRLEVRG